MSSLKLVGVNELLQARVQAGGEMIDLTAVVDRVSEGVARDGAKRLLEEQVYFAQVAHKLVGGEDGSRR